ncbi:protein BIG GRAIN 1-like [Typha angustifolia]|uniref:protein BIG GRAIN 1-like n=1 Tax=Typha angustifolia TaxID=59011 RepID=UPI003C2ED880
MERWGKTPSRARYGYSNGCDNPSFSSTLLDAIYRSIDENDGERADQRTGGVPYRSASLTAPKKKPAVSERAVTRIGSRRGFPNSTSSSSEGSSYGGFSSSEAESTGIRPIRTGLRSDPVRSPPITSHHQEKSKNSIRSKIRELRKSKTPASPGARIASFLNSIFTAGKTKSSAAAASRGARPAESSSSACSTASSYTRSCLSKTPSTRSAAGAADKRTVRFYPVSVIVDEECRPCGQKRIHGGEAMEAKKKVEDMMRIHRFDAEEEEEEEEEDSDASSDLFELENLAVIGNGGGGGGGGSGGGGGGGGYRDELPVYETTSLGTNRAIAHGLLR